MLRAPSGKFYIGSSKRIEYRWKQHEQDAKAGNHRNDTLINSYRKYGSLEKIILFECSESELLIHEQRFIDEMKPEYNRSRIAGKIEATPEVRLKLSSSSKKSWQDPEYRAAKSKIQSRVSRELWQNPEYRLIRSSQSSRLWQDPDYCLTISTKARAAQKEYWKNTDWMNERLFPNIEINPRRPDTHGHRAFAIILSNPGITRGNYFALGGGTNHLSHDLKRGWLKVLPRLR